MTGNSVVTIYIPPAQFSQTGGGVIPLGSPGATVSLGGSETGVSYQLELNNNGIGAAIAGNGGALSWPNLTSEGTYITIANKSANGCKSQMDGAAEIRIASTSVTTV